MTGAERDRIEALKGGIVFSERLRGSSFTFNSTWGLFSPRRIDEGSRLLLESIELKPGQVTLDLGCGYGALGIPIARETPEGEVHLVDRDYVAVDLARRNARENGLDNCRAYLSNGFSEVPPRVRFDAVVSNLPAKTGNEMLSILLHDAHAHLREGGRIWLVTISGLRKWLRRNLLEVFDSYHKVRQGKSYTVACGIR